MSMFKNVKVYLGLGPDEEYEDRYLDDGYPVDDSADGGYDEEIAPAGETGHVRRPQASGATQRVDSGPRALGSQPRPSPTRSTVQPRPSTQPSAVGAVRPLRPVPTGDDVAEGATPDELTIRRLDELGDDTPVRPRAIQHTKPKTVSPQSFGDAKILADEFKRSVPVVMNIRELDRDLSRRLIDFASGVCYSLGGAMEKLASGVFLLTPRGVEVSADDRRRLEERGFS